ncbi:MAG: TonB-dependent receptor plug domain-containing protein [Kordiimonas sp.]
MTVARMGAAFFSQLAMFGTSCVVGPLVAPSALVAEEVQLVDFQIRPQSLRAALLEYSEQASIQLILVADTSGLSFRRSITGMRDVEAVLIELLKNTGLLYEFTGSTTVTITSPPATEPVQSVLNANTADNKIDRTRLRQTRAIEEIILVGTRAEGRTTTETPVPIDLITTNSLNDTGQVEVGRMLQVLAPSFNFSTSAVSDGTDALRPATLRGLGPDQTLVLINGKRRHAAALVHVNTSVGRGTAGVDMNAVPGSALAGIEILRDGAAAQYGSDAIAGVINLRLREQSNGGEVSVQYGQTYEGDGETVLAYANTGFQLPNDGFANFTVEYSNRGKTNRAGFTGAVQFPLLKNGGGCDALDNSGCDPREFTFNRKNFRIGDADSEHYAFVLNSRLPLSDNVAAYTFGTYSMRDSQSAGFYRRANQYADTVVEIYPDGFLPLINTKIEDYSVAAGLEIDRTGSWSYDISVNHGRNEFQFIIENSLNASLGAASPTRGSAGTLSLKQSSVNFDAIRRFQLGTTETSIAFGGEYREESYAIHAGDPASYEDGGLLNTDCLGCENNPVAYSSGFQVFKGFSPENEVDEKRSNISFYADIESRITESWLITAAARFEDYSDFGNKLTGKFSTRVDVGNYMAFRGSLSSGFRAPAMQQKFFNSVSTQFVEPVGAPPFGATLAQQRGTFRNDSLVAELAGVPELKEETSFSYSAGLVMSYNEFTFAIDAYHIDINDRIGISGAIDLTQPGFEELAGVASTGQFFVNAADTETKGLDVVATYDMGLKNGHSLQLIAMGNWTETSVDRDTLVRSIGSVDVGPLFTPQDISIIEEWQPKSRASLSAKYLAENWSVVVRFNQFGAYSVCEGSCDSTQNKQRFGAKILADLQLNYALRETGIKLSIGANNLFDTYPDINEIGQARAGEIAGIVSSPGVFQYSRRSAPFGFNGGYWYARATYSF